MNSAFFLNWVRGRGWRRMRSVAFNELPGFAQEPLVFGAAGPPGLFHELTQIGKKRLCRHLLAKLELGHGQEGDVGGMTPCTLGGMELVRPGERIDGLLEFAAPV